VALESALTFSHAARPMTPEEIENELRELRSDIRAVATLEAFHASGAFVPLQSPGRARTVDEVNEYKAAVERLNSRYPHQPRG
jgi:hypothetical protein